MATSMAKVAKKEVEPAPIEPVEEKATDTAVLEGDNIETVFDFVDLDELQKSPLRLVNKDGVDVRKSIPQYAFAWFTDEDAMTWEAYGWRKVNDVFKDDVRGVIQSKTRRKDNGGHIAYRDLIAYCIPTERHEAYLEHVQKTNVIDVESHDPGAERVFRDEAGPYAGANVYRNSLP